MPTSLNNPTHTHLASAIARARDNRNNGLPYKRCLELLLAELTPAASDAFALLLDGGRGAWIPLLEGKGGRALFMGDACSGTVVALAHLGFKVLVLDACPARLVFGRLRAEGMELRVQHVLAGSDTALPIQSRQFELVVQEEGLPHPSRDWGHAPDELWRVCKHELLVTANNSLAYKRPTGQRGGYVKPSPLQWLRHAIAPAQGERPLRATMQALAWPETELHPFALYPNAKDFCHMVALDGGLPKLAVGAKEKKNALKVIGAKAGLFPLFTPSFAIHGSRKPGSSRRLDRILQAIAEHIDEPTPVAEYVISTRSNNCLVQTRPLDARGIAPGTHALGAPGWWVLHIPTNPYTDRMLRNDGACLRHIRKTFPHLPVPTPIMSGEVEGLFLHCEQRLPGLSAPQHEDEEQLHASMLMRVANDYSRLVVEPSALIDEERFEQMIAPRFRLARDLSTHAGTGRALDEMLNDVHSVLVGRRIPLVLYHADLRPKHIQLGADGQILGYYDWGASERCFLPYLDLLNLALHLSKGHSPNAISDCQRIAARQWYPGERRAFDHYANTLELEDEVRACLERTLPAFIAGMSERNWEFSRPGWIRSQFGIESPG